MSAEFWAGYISGAASIILGNPLDLLKVRLQAAQPNVPVKDAGVYLSSAAPRLSTIVTGTAVPILSHGALNAILLVSYKRFEFALNKAWSTREGNLSAVWLAGAVGGLCTWTVSAPTEIIKCRAQASSPTISSWAIARQIWTTFGLPGLYIGGSVTALRDCIGYGFYFWSYELANSHWPWPSTTTPRDSSRAVLCGGLAGIVAWASVFPLDVIKTRVQTQVWHPSRKRIGALRVAIETLKKEGTRAFFQGLTICSIRAFVVNAVHWVIYERILYIL
ncbi:hypothetical protein CDD83_6511 [Cordyceps sp. RAO-2017]|nr:hypothetical protein CDD83_6511 [Cordyceps sp. RAO-2017]